MIARRILMPLIKSLALRCAPFFCFFVVSGKDERSGLVGHHWHGIACLLRQVLAYFKKGIVLFFISVSLNHCAHVNTFCDHYKIAQLLFNGSHGRRKFMSAIFALARGCRQNCIALRTIGDRRHALSFAWFGGIVE